MSHCEDCRRTHGAAFVTWIGLPRKQFRFLEGEDRVRRYESEPGIEWEFCDRCGTQLFYECDSEPDKMYVVHAALEGPLDREPDSHVSFEEHAAWAPGLRDDLPRYFAKTDRRID